MGKVSHGFSIKFVILNSEFYFMVKYFGLFYIFNINFFIYFSCTASTGVHTDGMSILLNITSWLLGNLLFRIQDQVRKLHLLILDEVRKPHLPNFLDQVRNPLKTNSSKFRIRLGKLFFLILDLVRNPTRKPTVPNS